MPNWNLEKIYAEQVRDMGSVSQPRHVVREFTSKNQLKKAIIDNNPSLKAGTDKRGAIRMQPKSKIEDRDKFLQDFKKTLDDISLIIVGEIPAGSPGSPSSKYNSFKVKDASNNEYVITLGGGSFSNKGMDYERQILKKCEEYFNDPENIEKPSFLEKMEEYLGVEFVDLDKGTSFERRVKRPLEDEGPKDKGKEISDITLVDENGDKYFISIKNIGGKTVSNAGAKGMFKRDGDEIEFANQERNKIGGKLLDAANADIDKIIQGLEDYIKETPSQENLESKVDTTNESDIEQLQKFLGSAFDYGYIYVKQKNTRDDLEIADLTTKEGLYDFVGNIEKVEVKYPYYRTPIKSRKYASVIITTDKGIYSFDIRNASGGIIPDQINLVRGGSKQDIKLGKGNISKISTSDTEIENILSQYD
jgi:hypothetical protein